MQNSHSRVLLLGSTGSIGKSTLNCLRRFKGSYSIAGLAAGKSIDMLISQIREFSPQTVYLADKNGVEKLKKEFGSGLKICDSLEESGQRN